MLLSELPKPSIISADSANGTGFLYRPDGGLVSRTIHIEEQNPGETAKKAGYTIGILPPRQVIASYDVQYPAAIAGMCVYENADQELATDFSVQRDDWQREKVVAEAVFTPGLQSVVIHGRDALFGCTISVTGREPLIELFGLNPDKSICDNKGIVAPRRQIEFSGIRIRNNQDILYVEVEQYGLRSGIQLPLSMPYREFGLMEEMLHQPDPLGIVPTDLPFSALGASIRVASDDVYKL